MEEFSEAVKNIFIINPHSGKKRRQKKLIGAVEAAAAKTGMHCEIYFTKAAGDGERYIREVCEASAEDGEKLRIYACGGDGTINEAVNGAFGYENVEIGAVPMGTGNDYIRNYGTAEEFLDIEGQLAGTSVCSDLIYYDAEYRGVHTVGYCANMFNIGFDCNVVDMTSRVKKWPLAGGALAYLVSVAIILIEKKGADLTICYSDGSRSEGKILLTAVANGCYCGGGVKGVPYCELDDGFMDVSVVQNISRSFFVRLFPSYSKGTHMNKRAIQENQVIKYTKEKSLTITANGESLRLCTDGEITTQKKIEFKVVPGAFRFIIPAKGRSENRTENPDENRDENSGLK